MKLMGLPKVAGSRMGKQLPRRHRTARLPGRLAGTLTWFDPDSPSSPPRSSRRSCGAALDEFAAHGFHDASLNRVIDAAGISKGSMYYYFDGKEDLYAYVAQVELGGCSRSRTRPRSRPGRADAFWSVMEALLPRA